MFYIYMSCISFTRSILSLLMTYRYLQMMNPANQFEIKPDISSLTLSSATAGSSPDLNDPAVLEMKLRTLTSELNIAIEQRNESEHACEKLDTQVRQTISLNVAHFVDLRLQYIFKLS